MLAALAGVRGAMITPGDRVDDEFLAAGPGLQVVATLSVGLDHVDLDAARRRGVVVANTPDVLSTATAEMAVALMLSALRRVGEGDRLIRSRRPWMLSPNFMLGRSAAGLTFGCVGHGRIGREACRLAEALGMRTIHTSRRPTGLAGERTLHQLLGEADVVSLHCPLTAETRHLIDAAALSMMKPDAVLVNTARGPVVDEAALVEALLAGRPGAAALDVYEREPVVHEGLLDLPNTVLAPHLGSATHSTRIAMGPLCGDALQAVLIAGTVPANVVLG
ncbi:MAG: D-glycerate dehydrogenase [Thermoleophilia bacterium]